MADLLNTRPLDHTVKEIDYRPISGWAVAALSIAGLYVLLVGVIAATALYERRPAISVTWLILAVIGLVLSIVARIHIKRSEGTRAGLKQATLAWWLSVLGGAAFGAYIYASKLALEQQAQRAADEWFENLRTCGKDPVKSNQAFLMTVSPLHREDIDPANSADIEAKFGGTQLPGFRNSELIRYFERNGEDVTVKSLGVSNWQQIDSGYQLDYTFQLRSPEGIANLNIVVFGSEGKNIRGREWHIVVPQQGGLTLASSTTYGRLVNHLQDEAREVANTWLQSYQMRRPDYYLLTLPIAERTAIASRLDAIRIATGALGGGMIIPMAPTAPPNKEISADDLKVGDYAYYALQGAGFFDVGTITEQKKLRMREAFRSGFIVRAGESRFINPEFTPQFRITGEEIRYSVPIDMATPGKSGGFTGGRLIVVCQNPQLLTELASLREKGKANPDASDETPANLLTQRPPREWRVIRLQTNLEPLSAPKSPDGPRGMMGK